jgi:transcriptional regulator of arginine metabolism
VASFVREVRAAGPSITVVKTSIGSAGSVAAAIDKAGWIEVAGTVSGDDTIFIATADARAQTRVLDLLREAFGV